MSRKKLKIPNKYYNFDMLAIRHNVTTGAIKLQNELPGVVPCFGMLIGYATGDAPLIAFGSFFCLLLIKSLFLRPGFPGIKPALYN